MPRVFLPFVFSFLAAGLVGCSGADPAPPAGDSASQLAVQEAAGNLPEALDPTHTTRAPLAEELCTPRDVRECRWYYKDSNGQAQCPMSYQICLLDGKGWTPCGESLLDQFGNIIPR